jgi:anti-sigma B factor antagonist
VAATSNPTGVANLAIEERRVEGVSVLEVAGDLDLSSAPALCVRLERALEDRPAGVVVDLSRLEFCDSTGLRALAGAAEEARIRLARLVIVAPSRPAAARGFEIAGAVAFLPLVDELSTGLELVAG